MTPPRTAYTSPGDAAMMRGRLTKAREFLDAALTLQEFGAEAGVFSAGSSNTNAYVALCVLSGIAAADAICIRTTGEHHKGSDHGAAVAVLGAATDRSVAKHLEALVQVKNKAEYNARSVDDADIHRSGAAARALLALAEDMV